MHTFFGLLLPFLGTALGAACVFFMQKSLGDLVQRLLAGFAGRNSDNNLSRRDAYLVVTAAWVIFSLEPVDPGH